jgi:hypothetical protein
MNDFTSTSVGELRKMLIDSGKYSEEEANTIKGKGKLVEAVLALNPENEQEDESNLFTSLIDNLGSANLQLLEQSKSTKSIENPDYNSPEWHKHVMAQFTEDEKDGEYPTLFGLRRVAELILGPIIESGPVNISPPVSEDKPGRSTCVYTVVFNWGESGEERRFSAVGGAYEGNTDALYSVFPEAIAEARAEARTLRKALKLKVMAAEEAPKARSTPRVELQTVSTGEWNGSDPMGVAQRMIIEQKCKELGIDLDKLIKKEIDKEFNELTKEGAKSIIELINKYQQNTEIPEEIKKGS